MDYEYTTINRLKEPHKYSFSPYGEGFIQAYKSSRKKCRKGLHKAVSLDEILERKLETDTANKIKVLIKKPNDEILSRYIKKYEVTKKLWSEYSPDWKKASDRYDDPSQYLLLSLACMLRFQDTKNLKMLNTALKLNDLLCSLEIEDEFDQGALTLCLNLEKETITELYSSLHINL